jgi:hypothetical protein
MPSLYLASGVLSCLPELCSLLLLCELLSRAALLDGHLDQTLLIPPFSLLLNQPNNHHRANKPATPPSEKPTSTASTMPAVPAVFTSLWRWMTNYWEVWYLLFVPYEAFAIVDLTCKFHCLSLAYTLQDHIVIWRIVACHAMPCHVVLCCIKTNTRCTTRVANIIHLPVNDLMHRTDFLGFDRRAYLTGVGIFVVYILLQVTWLGSWAVTSAIWRWFRRANPRAKLRRVMQASLSELTLVQRGQAASERFRRCERPQCRSETDPASYVLGDRVWHSTATGKHFALWDHYCPFIGGIYLDNIKPFLLTQFYMVLNAFFFLCVSVYELATTGRHAAFRLQAGGVLLALVSFVSAAYHCYWWFYELAWKDRVAAERGVSAFFYMARTQRGRSGQLMVEFFRLKHSPWDQGTGLANLRSVLGDQFWQWPLSFLAPRRVREYGRRPGSESDLALGPLWREVERRADDDDRTPLSDEEAPWQTRWKALPVVPMTPQQPERFLTPSRRQQARSSGIDLGEIEMEDLG